ncbi:MAG: PPOX class F420-dependent oxidoreductase [Microbacteriaceae bacterium]
MNTDTFAPLASAKYVSLTTFRKTGDRVDTAVWFAVSGDSLVVTTAREAGKIKRIRHTSAVELRECTARGQVVDDAPIVLATATIEDSDKARAELKSALSQKYGFMYAMLTFTEKFSRSKVPSSVMIRLSPRS